MKLTIYIKVPSVISGGEVGHKYYRASVSQAWAIKHDNGALFSFGLTVGEDGLTEKHLARIDKVEVSHDEWNHSGCQSGCVLRGAKECRW